MSTTQAPCFSTPEQARLQLQTVPFERIPHQSRLFLDYLSRPELISGFYGDAVKFIGDPSLRTSEVLENYRVDRKAVCDALERMNRNWGASEETLGNIEKLRSPDCCAIVTGQQAGLFTGPLYTIHKALTAVKHAECLTERGTPSVAVFWIATEDHDFAEVATVEYISSNCKLASVTASSSLRVERSSVGSVILDDSIHQTITRVIETLPTSEFMPAIENLLRDSYLPGKGFSEAFGKMMTTLLGRFGLIFLDPRDEALKQIAAPLYAGAALNASSIATALETRSRELESSGYHAQVMATVDSFPLFLQSSDNVRHALSRMPSGHYKLKDSPEEFSAEQLSAMAEAEPSRFSPNVTLRAVVQDFLLPTLAYIGGSAEIAYFAQTSEVYRILNRPITPVIPRASMTIVESRIGRTLDRYGLNLESMFGGLENLMSHIVEEHLGSATAAGIDRAESSINDELDRLREQLDEVDPTLAQALDNGRRKINYQLEGLRSRFHRSLMNQDEAATRQIERAFEQLYPHKALQERHISVVSLLARHGHYVIDWIFDAINLGSFDHQVVRL